MSYLRTPTTIPWEALHAQFGASYGRTVDFRVRAERALRKVRVAYRAAKIEPTTVGLRLRPSRTHIAARS